MYEMLTCFHVFFKIDELSVKPFNPSQVIPGMCYVLIWFFFIACIMIFFFLKAVFSLQAQPRLLRSMTTLPFLNFHLFLTRSQPPPSERTPTHQTTLTLTTCHGALKSSRRRPNYREHIWESEHLSQLPHENNSMYPVHIHILTGLLVEV